MATPSYSEEVRRLTLDMLWSLWTELGASGWTRRHRVTAVDLEPLILTTSMTRELDARLGDEALEWCVANSRIVSSVRLRNLLKTAMPDTQRRFGNFAATVRSHIRINWPGEGEPHPFTPVGRSSPPELTRPALLQLRLRAVVGVSARAEILRLLLSAPSSAHTVAKLASDAAYTKANVAAALDLLAGAGIVESGSTGHQHRYRLAQPVALSDLFGPLPLHFPDWTPRFRVVNALLVFAATAPGEGMPRAAEARRLVRGLEPELRRLGIGGIRSAGGEAVAIDFEQWSVDLLRGWAGDEGSPDDSAETVYTADRLSNGSWLGTMVEPGGTRRPMALPEWTDQYHEVSRSDTIIADDATGAPRLAHAMFEHAWRRMGVEIGQYHTAPDHLNRWIARNFAEERLWPVRPGQSVAFGEAFLRAWYENQKAQMT